METRFGLEILRLESCKTLLLEMKRPPSSERGLFYWCHALSRETQRLFQPFRLRLNTQQIHLRGDKQSGSILPKIHIRVRVPRLNASQ